MEKIIAVLLALMLCLTLIACGNNEGQNAENGSDVRSETSVSDFGGSVQIAKEEKKMETGVPVGDTEASENAEVSGVPETAGDNENGIYFTMLSSGNSHALALDTKGRIWGWGKNQHGCLGAFDTVTHSPVLFCDTANFTFVQASIDFSIALDADGGLWTWGTNTCGQLGDGTTEERGEPVRILENVTMAAAGYDYVAAIADGGKLYTWGNGNNHMLLKEDYNDTANILTPTPVATESEFSYIVSGRKGCIAYDINGTRYAWGISSGVAGYYPSQIGSDSEESVIPYVLKPIADDCIGASEFTIYGNTVYALYDGDLYLAGGKDSRLASFESNPSFNQFSLVQEGVRTISPSMYGTLIIDADGNVWGWGGKAFLPCSEGKLKQLTSGIEFSDVVILSYNNQEVFAIDESGILYSWSADGEIPTQVPVA